MATPMTSTAHSDVLDRRFSGIFDDTYKSLDEMRPLFFNVAQARKGADEKMSQLGELGDMQPFDGQFEYDAAYQGYDVTATHKEWGLGMQVKNTLIDDDLFNVMDRQPAKLARAASRTLENHSSRILTMAFSLDNLFYSHSEGVPLCSNSHTTTSGASTATGFDNLGTAALSATAVASNRIQMRGFRGDRGQRINVMPNELWISPDLYETAYEIVSSLGKVNTADNNANVHYGQYTIYEWNYMSSATDWFMTDSMARKENALWFNRKPVDFANTTEFETLVRKWRVYARYSYMWVDWRWIMGNDV
jgi:hypothetical protein